MSGIYTGSLGMISASTRLNTISNNIANSNTDAFKADQSTYRTWDETYTKIESKEDTRVIGAVKELNYVDNVQTNFAIGDARQTGFEYDFYLQDDQGSEDVSFFVIQKEGQTYLSRNGHFMLDSERNVVNANGGYLLNAQGNKIQIPEGVEVSLSTQGVLSDQKSGTIYGQINIQSVNESQLGLLEKKYGGYYQPITLDKINTNFGSAQWVLDNFDTNKTLQEVFGSKENVQNMITSGQVNVLSPFSGNIRSGMLESSNVDLAKEMVDMMETQRYFQANSKSFSVMDQIFAKEASEIGK